MSGARRSLRKSNDDTSLRGAARAEGSMAKVKRRRHLAGGVGPTGANGSSHFPPSLLYVAAKMYYTDEATQAEVAEHLQTSRATISRLLYEARRRGIVRIEVIPTDSQAAHDLGSRVAAVFGLTAVYISEPPPVPGRGETIEDVMGSTLAAAVSRALLAVGLDVGDVMLVSSGRTIYEVARFELPKLPGVVVAPTVGGTDQPEAWYQTNEITRLVAQRIGGRPTFLFAPALPGAELFQTLQTDPGIQRVLQLWPHARCVLTGVGAPPLLRSEAPQFVDMTSPHLIEAVGDVCSRFFNRAGEPVLFPGSERLIAVDMETLKSIPTVIAVAAGTHKVATIIAAARAKLFNQLVTDPRTAEDILARA
jgi:DNA-binding transcriptional regulator LsrR (DeoR family)